MTNGMPAMGTFLRRNGVEIAEVTEISGPAFEAEELDYTHLRSPGFWREIGGGLKNGGDVTLTVNFNPADPTHNAATGLLSAFAGSTQPPTDTYELVFPDDDTTTWTFPAFVKGYEPSIPFEDKLSADITLRVAGAPTLA
jgi:hypothetical protein